MDGFDLNAEPLIAIILFEGLFYIASIFGFADNILFKLFRLLKTSFFLLMGKGEDGGRRLKLSISSGNGSVIYVKLQVIVDLQMHHLVGFRVDHVRCFQLALCWMTGQILRNN